MEQIKREGRLGTRLLRESFIRPTSGRTTRSDPEPHRVWTL